MYTKKQIKKLERWLRDEHNGHYLDATISDFEIAILRRDHYWLVEDFVAFCESVPFSNPRLGVGDGELMVIFDADHSVVTEVLEDETL